MQTAETFSLTSLFKLSLLFVLLITGVMLKATDTTPLAEASELKASPPSPVLEADSSTQKKQLYFWISQPKASSAAL